MNLKLIKTVLLLCLSSQCFAEIDTSGAVIAAGSITGIIQDNQLVTINIGDGVPGEVWSAGDFSTTPNAALSDLNSALITLLNDRAVGPIFNGCEDIDCTIALPTFYTEARGFVSYNNPQLRFGVWIGDEGDLSPSWANASASSVTLGVVSYSAIEPVPEPEAEPEPELEAAVIPDVPQQSLSRIIRTDGTATDSTISIGASADGGNITDTTFTVDDEVTLTAKVYPDSSDLGEEGELYVVMRSTIDGKKTFFALNEDGIWESLNASLKTLPAEKFVESLEEVEDVLV